MVDEWLRALSGRSIFYHWITTFGQVRTVVLARFSPILCQPQYWDILLLSLFDLLFLMLIGICVENIPLRLIFSFSLLATSMIPF